jgi:hypothetical protein
MFSPSSPHSHFLASWIGLEVLKWIFWDTWFMGARFFVGVIALCRASLTHALAHLCFLPHGHVFRVCTHLLGHGALFIYSTQHGNLTIHNISCFLRQITNPNARGPMAENGTRAQFDHHDVYSTCHVENFEKGRFISKNQWPRGHTCIVMG